MNRKEDGYNNMELKKLCDDVREMVKACRYDECDEYLKKAMGTYPNSAVPHNLYGLLYEKCGEHVQAMKHFRAAWALDSSYLPARFNLNCFGTFMSREEDAYWETDCPELTEKKVAHRDMRTGM